MVIYQYANNKHCTNHGLVLAKFGDGCYYLAQSKSVGYQLQCCQKLNGGSEGENYLLATMLCWLQSKFTGWNIYAVVKIFYL